MSNSSNSQSKIVPWIMFIVVTLIPLLAWANLRDWNFSSLNAYSIFPVLGLLAWSIMWTHYAIGGLNALSANIHNRVYSRVSGYIVLILILLHPALLLWKQWQVTGLLPPESAYLYVGDALKGSIIVGFMALAIFLSFEFFDRMKSRESVKRLWRWVSVSQALAMTMIFFHALSIGSITNQKYFELYWVVMGAVLVPCFGLVLRTEWNRFRD